VKQEGSHCQDIAPASDTLERATLLAQGPGRLYRQATVPMRSGNDTERAIRRPAVIEVRTHGNERLQHSQRRVDVENTFLPGPTGAVAVWNTFPDRNTKILVQRNEPVVARGLVEERALDGHSARGKKRPDLGVRLERRR